MRLAYIVPTNIFHMKINRTMYFYNIRFRIKLVDRDEETIPKSFSFK